MNTNVINIVIVYIIHTTNISFHYACLSHLVDITLR